jgi:hypothetical protein
MLKLPANEVINWRATGDKDYVVKVTIDGDKLTMTESPGFTIYFKKAGQRDKTIADLWAHFRTCGLTGGVSHMGLSITVPADWRQDVQYQGVDSEGDEFDVEVCTFDDASKAEAAANSVRNAKLNDPDRQWRPGETAESFQARLNAMPPERFVGKPCFRNGRFLLIIHKGKDKVLPAFERF